MQPKTIIEIYEEVLSGERQVFPPHTWSTSTSRSDLIKVIRYLILEKLEMSRDALLEVAYLKFWYKHRLGGAIRKISKQDTRAFIIECFPEWNIKYWEFKIAKTPVHYWRDETLVAATKWLIEDVLEWDLDKVQNEISNLYFHQNGLGGMLQTMNVGAVDAVIKAYPNHDWTYLKERRGYKLTHQQAQKIRVEYEQGVSMNELARWYDVTVASIFDVIHNKTFKIAPHA